MVFFFNIIFGYASLKKLRFIILKFKIKLKNAINKALDKTNSINILDILNAE